MLAAVNGGGGGRVNPGDPSLPAVGTDVHPEDFGDVPLSPRERAAQAAVGTAPVHYVVEDVASTGTLCDG